jgi:hypothetical protein
MPSFFLKLCFFFLKVLLLKKEKETFGKKKKHKKRQGKFIRYSNMLIKIKKMAVPSVTC